METGEACGSGSLEAEREMKWMKDLRQSIREMGWGEVKLVLGAGDE